MRARTIAALALKRSSDRVGKTKNNNFNGVWFMVPRGAAAGATGSLDLLDRERVYEVSRMAADLGERWLITETYIKPYASCRYTHPVIDAILDMKAQEGIEAGEIHRLEIQIFPEAREDLQDAGSGDYHRQRTRSLQIRRNPSRRLYQSIEPAGAGGETDRPRRRSSFARKNVGVHSRGPASAPWRRPGPSRAAEPLRDASERSRTAWPSGSEASVAIAFMLGFWLYPSMEDGCLKDSRK
ncbi:MmgE/PrpD family protein [Chelativorans xinjiangense]|uniref:MmgE/PrpD family protein n=1 Tax=Chelativorans xinjiangense TaxID=2681485 RepID=UPI00135733E9|nr:MmgE/PrpD family protein [Chelativorans xinjiangense]